MMLGDDALSHTAWADLTHAYGRAVDTPGHLRALLGTDDEARQACMTHLWSAIIHQGTPWMATAPVARVLAGWLSSDQIRRDDPLRATLLSFLTAVADAAEDAKSRNEIDPDHLRRVDAHLTAGEDDLVYEDMDLASALFYRDQRACLEVLPALLPCVMQDSANPDPVIRASATRAAATILGLAKSEETRDLAQRLRRMADAAANGDERCAHVLALGDLGEDTSTFLADPSPAVRMCAALAPALADAPAATDELIAALHQAAKMDDWFVERPRQFQTRPRFAVIKALVARVASFDRIVDAAIAVVPLTSFYTVDFDVKPLLLKAFPGGDGIVATNAQRRFLRAMVDNDKLWEPTSGNCALMFKAAGLPHDREACRNLCK